MRDDMRHPGTVMGQMEKTAMRNRMAGPCDDDYERTAPYIDLLPEETEDEEPSPLNFSRERVREDGFSVHMAMRPRLPRFNDE